MAEGDAFGFTIEVPVKIKEPDPKKPPHGVSIRLARRVQAGALRPQILIKYHPQQIHTSPTLLLQWQRKETPNMVEQFAEFKELKNIDKTTMISVLEESFRNVLAKMFGTDENLDVILGTPTRATCRFSRTWKWCARRRSPRPQPADFPERRPCRRRPPRQEVGESTPRRSFSRNSDAAPSSICARHCRQNHSTCRKKQSTTSSRILEGELITAEVYQTWSRETLLLDDERTS